MAVADQQIREKQNGDWASDDQSGSQEIDEQKEVTAAASTQADVEDQQKPQAPAVPAGGPPPNGGLQAWLQVVGAFCLFFNTWGFLNTFGSFQTYYESGQLFHASSSNISWIGTIQAVCVMFVSVVAGPTHDRGYFKHLISLGSFMIVFGHMMLSLCHEYWQCLLAQGFVVGLGGGCIFVPCVAILPTWFTTNAPIAIGLATSGASLGGIIYPIVFYKLIGQIGFAWTVRTLGFIALGMLIVPIAVMKQRAKPLVARSFLDPTAFKDYPYMIFVIGCMLGYASIYIGFFYTSFFGLSAGYTNNALSFYLVPILNASSILGRTLPNYLAGKFGGLNVLLPGAILNGVSLLCYLGVFNAGGMIVSALAFGLFSGFYIALPHVVFVQLTEDKRKVGTRIGMGFFVIGLGILAGAPGAGGIIGTNMEDLDWTGCWLYAGLLSIASSAIFVVVRFMKVGPKLKAKI